MYQNCNFSDKCVLNLSSVAGLATFSNKFYDVFFFHFEDCRLKTKEIRIWVFALKVYVYFAAPALGP